MKYICKNCGKTQDVNSIIMYCECGGLWSLDFDTPRFDPSIIDKDIWGLFRYRAFLPVKDGYWEKTTLGEGMTPIVRIDNHVLLKMDYCMPTLSFKDRGTAVLMTHLMSLGVESVVQDSSGNAGNSVAAYAAKLGIDCEIYVPEGASIQKINMIRAHGAKCIVVPGSRDNCANVCRSKAETEGLVYASHVINPFFYQGTKTYIYEIYEQLGRIPPTIFVPIGNGTLFLGIMIGLEELLASGCISKMPKIVGVQSEYCDPLVAAYRAHETNPCEVQTMSTLAEGIAIGKPMRGAEIMEYVYKHDVELITAPESKIIDARKMLAKKGIYCEHTSAAIYSAYLNYADRYGDQIMGDILIPMCGAGLKSDH